MEINGNVVSIGTAYCGNIALVLCVFLKPPRSGLVQRPTHGEVLRSETEQNLGAAKRNRHAFVVRSFSAGLFFFCTSIGPSFAFAGDGTTPTSALLFFAHSNRTNMLPRRLQCFNLGGSAAGAVYKRNKLYRLFLQAFADGVFILLVEVFRELEYGKQ